MGWRRGGLGWRRRLIAWEEDLMGEVRTLLSNVNLQESGSDVWHWRPNVGDGSTVCGMYQMLMRQEVHNYNVVTEAVWHESVPLKVSICLWRLFRNRWPIKDNLVRRSVNSNWFSIVCFRMWPKWISISPHNPLFYLWFSLATC